MCSYFIRHACLTLHYSERAKSTLVSDLHAARTDLGRVESARQTLELNHDMQNAHQQRQLASLQREMEELRTMPDLQNAFAELEERNNDMEELLRLKTAEIEENDDRSLE